MIPQGRTFTSVWQVHSLGDLNSFLLLCLPLYCSPTPLTPAGSGGSWTNAGTGRAWALLLRIAGEQWASASAALNQLGVTDCSRQGWQTLAGDLDIHSESPSYQREVMGNANPRRRSPWNTHIPEIFTQPLKEICCFSPIVSFLWHIFLGLQVCEQYFLQEYLFKLT